MRPYLTTLICMVLAVVSCTRTTGPEALPPGDVRILTVGASLPGTRFSVDRGKVAWSEGDAIAVYNTAGARFELVLSEGAGSSFGRFSGSFSGTLDTRFAIHPAAFAGSNPGILTIPPCIGRSDNVPTVMASELEVSGSEVNALRFHHLMAVMEFTLRDLPACAQAFRLVSASGTQISGDFAVNASGSGVEAGAGGSDSRTVFFPCKTAYGAEGRVKVYIPLPANSYPDLAVQVLDGDGDLLEGTSIPVPETSANLKAGDYVAMPELNVRALTGGAQPDYIKVQGIRWAKGNLLRDENLSNGTWVRGWGLHANQWEFEDGQESQEKYDHFNWGGISAAAYQTDSVVVYPNTGASSGTKVAYYTYIWPRGNAVDIQGRTYRYQDGTNERAFDYSLLDGTGKGAPYFFYSGNNDGSAHPKTWESGGTPASVKTFSSYFGDLPFWASKGQYMMPGASDFETLVNGANQQAGYYEAGGKRIYGMLFTSCGPWQQRTTDLSFRPLDDGDMESGLFLPLSGYRKPRVERDVATKADLSSWSPASSEITAGGTAGAYWAAEIASSGVASRRPQMLYMLAGDSSSCSISFGDSASSESVTISPTRSCNVFSTPAGLAVRPIYLSTTQPEPQPEPEPEPEPSGNGFPAIWEITSSTYGTESSPTAAGRQWLEKGIAVATNNSSTSGVAYIATSSPRGASALTHTFSSNGCPAVGGLDEGDCIEFCSPVENLPAGTDFDLMLTVNANNKALPKDWLLEYWENGGWKAGDAPYTAAEDPSVRYSCTILRPSTSCYRTLVLSFTLGEAVGKGFVRARLRAVGKINGNGARLTPSSGALLYFAPMTYVAARFICYAGAPAVRDTKKILVLGNSFTYYYGSAFMLKELARREGHQLEMRISLKGSNHFYNHLYDIDYSKEAVAEGGFDYAMLQDGTYFAAEYAYGDASVISGGAAYTPEQVLQYTKEMDASIRASSPNAQIMYEICKTSPTETGDFSGFGSYDAFDEYQRSGAFALAGADPNINWINPVGVAARNARANYGFTSGYNYLNYTDNSHPTRECQYLKACTTYLIMFGEDFGSCPAECGIASSDAAKLRQAAKDIALTDRANYKIR